MKLGVTGTRKGMTDAQRKAILRIFTEIKQGVHELHHGDCVGVDNQVAVLADLFLFDTVCHPPLKDDLRAFHHSTERREKKSYLERDRDIANEADMLFVIPYEEENTGEGGTWYTNNYAEKTGTSRTIIYPSGRIEIVISEKDRDLLELSKQHDLTSFCD